jgi:hypothetical protein
MSSRTWSFFVSALLVLAGCGGSDAPDASGGPDVGRDAAPTCAEDVDCEDGLFCNGESQCSDGRCVAGPPPTCDDSLACTRDFCSEELRACVNRPTDADGDGHPDLACLDARGMPLGDDCDDTTAAIHPGAAELCDTGAVDEDCDPETLGARDGDGDGFVDVRCCNGARCGDDCNDAVRGASPTGTEVCNGLDDDCSGDIDEGVLVTVYRDADGDGHGDATMARMACASSGGYSVEADDCDDSSALRSPALFEACDGVDNDCDGTPDPADVPDVVSWYEDRDGDGFGDRRREVLSCSRPMGAYSLLGTDCDDANRAVHPAQAEQCNGLDDDCNGAADFVIAPGDLEDDDEDGRPDAACTPRPAPAIADCDDRDAASGPGDTEICDGRDNDCDGSVDEGVEATPFFRDADGDGYGSETSGVVVGCGSVAGYIERSGDCDDTDSERHPTRQELCNGADEDCDGTIDEELGAESCTSIETPRECIAGRCRDVLACDPPTADCDALVANGCESDLASDPARCGACDRTCRATEPGTVAICVSSSCGLACVEGQEDCDADLGRGLTGCETVLGTAANCARCGDACAVDERCNPVTRVCEAMGGGCVFPAADCDMNGSCEVDLSADVLHCGSCTRECSGASAGWTCAAGNCRVESCSLPMLNCDMSDANGCETDGATLTNCRGCGVACEGRNATWTCGAMGCEVRTCLVDFDDCDGVDATGCETNVGFDPRNCGMCGRDCYEPRAFGGCIEGACGPLTCEGGYLDCNGDLGTGGDGCETMGASCPTVLWGTTWGTIGDDRPVFGPLTLLDVDVDAANNTYVVAGYATLTRLAGTDFLSSRRAALVVSFSPSGALRWIVNLNGVTATTVVDVLVQRLVVRGGNVYLAGSASGGGSVRVNDTTTIGTVGASPQPLAIALSSGTGTFLWARLLDTSGGADFRGLTASADGASVWAAGFFASEVTVDAGLTLSGSDDGFVVRMNGASGVTTSSRVIGGTGLQAIEAIDYRDFDGDLLLGGYYLSSSWSYGTRTFSGTASTRDGWALRCNGALTGCGASVNLAGPGEETVSDVRAGLGGVWAFSGVYEVSANVGGTALFDTTAGGFVGAVGYVSGTVQWGLGHSGAMTLTDGVRRVRWDAAGRLRCVFGTTGGGTFAGTTVPTTAIVQPYIARINESGVLHDLTAVSSTSALDALALAVRGDGATVISGTVYSSSTIGGVFVPGPGNADVTVFARRPLP